MQPTILNWDRRETEKVTQLSSHPELIAFTATSITAMYSKQNIT